MNHVFPQAITEFETVGLELADLARSVLDCQRVGMYTIEPEAQRLHPLVVIGLSEKQERTWRHERSRQQVDLQQILPAPDLAHLFQHRGVIIDRSHPAFVYFAYPSSSDTVLIAPIQSGERFMGIIVLDFGSVRPISKQDESALSTAVARLCTLVIDRQRLAVEREHAQKQVAALREVNHRMEEFLNIVSHELRTPLTTIKANTQLAMRRLKSLRQHPEWLFEDANAKVEASYEMMVRSERQVDVLNRLVGDLVDISRIQAGRLHLRQEICDLLQIVRVRVEEQRQAHPERIIDVHVPDVERILVLADADRIGQVLVNYLTNALKYSEASQPVYINVELELLVAGVPGVKISVQDRGQGLPPAEQRRVWECFYQSQEIKVLSGSRVGLGLGLYISQTLIECHGGQVGVESQQGVGSLFWFTLPLAQTAEMPVQG